MNQKYSPVHPPEADSESTPAPMPADTAAGIEKSVWRAPSRSGASLQLYRTYAVLVIQGLRSRRASYTAFLAAVLACLIAAVTVASNDLPLHLGGL